MSVPNRDQAENVKARALALEGFSIFEGALAGDEALSEALAAYCAERYEAAVQGFEVSLASMDRLSDSELGQVFVLYCRCMAALGETKAAAVLSEYEAVQPRDVIGFLRRVAYHFHETERFAFAKMAYARSVRLNPLDDNSLINLCLLLEQDDEIDELTALIDQFYLVGGGSADVAVLAVRVGMTRPEWGGYQRLVGRSVKHFPDRADLWHASSISWSITNAPLSALLSARRSAELDAARRFISYRCHLPFNA